MEARVINFIASTAACNPQRVNQLLVQKTDFH